MAVFCLWATAGLAQDGGVLSWDRWDVQAHLDDIGRLHIRERQTLNLTGDWNGGQRTFDLHGPQRMSFGSIKRIDPATGESHRLWRGLTRFVNFYDWYGVDTLRWRSRSPSDPPFDQTRLVYELEYTMTNVLRLDGNGRYQLEHIFGPADRPGGVHEGIVTLTLDPIWRNVNNIPTGTVFRDAAAGTEIKVTMPLEYLGTGVPRGAGRDVLPSILWIAALLVVVPAILLIGFIVRERRRLVRPGVDDAWVEQNVLAHPPEVIGTAWDGTVGQPELAALLARMEQEGKVSTRVEGLEMRMRLLVDRATLKDRELEIVEALFPAGDETSTEAIRVHYTKGFDPAAKIRGGLLNAAREIIPDATSAAYAEDRFGGWMMLIGIVLMWWGLTSSISHWVNPLPGLAGLFLFALIALAVIYSAMKTEAVAFSADVELSGVLGFLWPLLLAAAGLTWVAIATTRVDPLTIFGFALLLIAYWFRVLRAAGSRESRTSFEFRQRLAAARRRIAGMLQAKSAMEPRFVPYALAFGLSEDVDRWFTETRRRAGGTAISSSSFDSTTPTASSSSASAASSPAALSEGGGAFGGAGASGSWGTAMNAVGAPVPAQSSGGSGGGGWSSDSSSGGSSSSDSSSSSSGGGSAGGW